jgi:chemotaxis protein MotB
MAGHGGGAWKVAYADFVTAMMAFFLVMWIVAQGKAVKEAVAGYFKDPANYKAKAAAAGQSLMPSDRGGAGGTSIKPLLNGLNPGGKGGPVGPKTKNQPSRVSEASVFVLHDGKRRTSGTVVQFGETSAELDERATETLKQLVPSILGKRNKIEIRGHAMRRPLPPDGPFKDSWQLCYARCLATMQYLQKAGVDPDRFRMSQAGPYEPQSLKIEPEWQANNARVEIYVLNELADDLMGTNKERTQRVKQ